MPPAVEAQSPNHWTTGEIHNAHFQKDSSLEYLPEIQICTSKLPNGQIHVGD